MVISCLREIIELTVTETQRATLTIVTYILTALIFCGSYSIATTLYLIYQYRKMELADRKKKMVIKSVSSFVQITAAILYLYGDNYKKLVAIFEALGCDDVCLENSQIAAFFCLGVAFIIFHVAPPVLKKCFELIVKEEKQKKSPWLLAVGMIAVMARIDMLYSVVFEIVNVLESCSDTGIIASFMFITISSTFGALAVTVHCIHALRNEAGKHPYFKALAIFGLVIIIVCMPLYIIGDNNQPLDCVFNCTVKGSECDSTMNGVSEGCMRKVNSSVRFGFNLFTLVSITSITILYSSFFCCTKKGHRFTVVYSYFIRFTKRDLQSVPV